MAMEQAICEQDPERPSTVVGRRMTRGNGDGEAGLELAAGRLRGDLDNIVLMALRKEPEARYPSVSALSADVDRYLDHRPVLARPQTVAYRAQRFFERHALATALSVLALLLLIAGLAGTAWQARTARLQRDRAQAEARKYVIDEYGEEFVPPQPPHYKTKAKAAQEAHEAIRPTSVFRTPSSLKKMLDRDQHRLYELIWRRLVSSQMARAVYDTVVVEISAGPDEDKEERPYLFRASGSTLRFPGFLIVYEEERDEDEESPEERKREEIPPLSPDELLDLIELLPDQHFTKAAPRYSEATLVRDLEEYGIGRPSTYAPILSKIQERSYVERRGKRLFRMAPIHHHFELKGWAESRVVVRLWIVGILLALLSLSTFKIR